MQKKAGFTLNPEILEHEDRKFIVLQKLRQQVKESSKELRDLEAKFQACFIYKEQREQLKQKRILKEEEKAFTEDEDQHIIKYWQNMDQAEENNMKIRREKLQKDQEIIRQQMREKELKRIKELQNKLQERLEIDKIAYQIYEEDEQEKQRKKEKQEEQKQIMHEFLEARSRWKEREKWLIEQENRKIKEYWDEKSQKTDIQTEKRQERLRLHQEIQDSIRKRLMEEQVKMKELEDLKLTLAQEEQWLINYELDKLEEKKKQEVRLELQKMEEIQIKEKEERRRREREEELELRRELTCQLEADMKLHEKTERVKRLKQKELREEIEKLLAISREQKEREKKMEMDELQYNNARLQFHNELVEQERQKLLKELGPQLVGYLAPGLIRSHDDLKLIGPKALEYYCEKVEKHE